LKFKNFFFVVVDSAKYLLKGTQHFKKHTFLKEEILNIANSSSPIPILLGAINSFWATLLAKEQILKH